LVPSDGTIDQVLQTICECIDGVITDDVIAIGIGVPSVVDIEKGIVYDVQNIPSWQEVHLKDILEKKYGKEVFINNDANCFALGEKHFGLGKDCGNFAALIIGTGIAAGLIIDNKIYNGANCGAGEFGMIPYLDHHFEYYSSGQFFQNIHEIDGETLNKQATEGNVRALEIFDEFGRHVGNTIKAILYAIDPEKIIIGGSVSKSFSFYKNTMWEQIRTLAYRSVIDNLVIEISKSTDIAVLGAAALYHNEKLK
jgi:glucokinase